MLVLGDLENCSDISLTLAFSCRIAANVNDITLCREKRTILNWQIESIRHDAMVTGALTLVQYSKKRQNLGLNIHADLFSKMCVVSSRLLKMLAWPRVTYSRHGRVIRARHLLPTEDLTRVTSEYNMYFPRLLSPQLIFLFL